MAGLLLWIIKCIKVGFEEVRKRVSFAEDIPCSGSEDGTGTRTSSGKSFYLIPLRSCCQISVPTHRVRTGF